LRLVVTNTQDANTLISIIIKQKRRTTATIFTEHRPRPLLSSLPLTPPLPGNAAQYPASLLLCAVAIRAANQREPPIRESCVHKWHSPTAWLRLPSSNNRGHPWVDPHARACVGRRRICHTLGRRTCFQNRVRRVLRASCHISSKSCES
jgi:hypothetical protein